MMDDSLLVLLHYYHIRAEISPPELLFFLLLDSTQRRTKNSYKSYRLLSTANLFLLCQDCSLQSFCTCLPYSGGFLLTLTGPHLVICVCFLQSSTHPTLTCIDFPFNPTGFNSLHRWEMTRETAEILSFRAIGPFSPLNHPKGTI